MISSTKNKIIKTPKDAEDMTNQQQQLKQILPYHRIKNIFL